MIDLGELEHGFFVSQDETASGAWRSFSRHCLRERPDRDHGLTWMEWLDHCLWDYNARIRYFADRPLIDDDQESYWDEPQMFVQFDGGKDYLLWLLKFNDGLD